MTKEKKNEKRGNLTLQKRPRGTQGKQRPSEARSLPRRPLEGAATWLDTETRSPQGERSEPCGTSAPSAREPGRRPLAPRTGREEPLPGRRPRQPAARPSLPSLAGPAGTRHGATCWAGRSRGRGLEPRRGRTPLGLPGRLRSPARPAWSSPQPATAGRQACPPAAEPCAPGPGPGARRRLGVPHTTSGWRGFVCRRRGGGLL